MAYSGDSPVLGYGTVSSAGIDAWFAANGPSAASQFAPDRTYKPAPVGLGAMIIRASHHWESDGGVADYNEIAADIAKESAFWQSAIVRAKNNPSGLGAENDDPMGKAVTFDTPYEGILATVAHWLTYAKGKGPWNAYDPRYAAVEERGWLGVVVRLRDLNGRWAWPGEMYGQGIATLANALVNFAKTVEEPTVSAQIPGFVWYPADDRHHTKGRTQRVRGGAQHYTAGTNSLDYLTTTSPPEDNKAVSATFLVKHNATVADRGWQLVRIEDTAWTTAYANPYTVSIEYEHLASQSIPDSAYEALAQTWVDVDGYLRRNGLGAIDVVAGHKTWVNNPSLICPDGIDIARINARYLAIKAGAQPQPEPSPQSEHRNGFLIGGGIYQAWRAVGGADASVGGPGEPLSNEIGGADAERYNATVVQWFERGRAEWSQDRWPSNWDVTWARTGAELMELLAQLSAV